MLRWTAKPFLVLLFALIAPAWLPAQVAALLPGQTSAQPATAAGTSDLLGRETPRGAILGFIRAAQEEKYSVGAQYFQPASSRHHPSAAQEQELASDLLTILNQKFGPFLDSVSRDPQGRLDDGLPADQERIASGREAGSFAILLVRVEDEHGQRLWFISRKTLEEIPKVFDSLRFPRIEASLPRFVVENRPLGMPLWQWLSIILLVPVAFGLAWLLVLLGRAITGRVRGKSLGPAPVPRRRFGPGALLLTIIIHYNGVFLLGVSLLYRQYYTRLVWILLVISFYWALTRASSLAAERIGRYLSESGRMAERSLVSLARRLLNALVFVFLGLIVLSSLGVNVTAALAGLGIGGLAIGLGAQKTFENLLGGIAILSDRALQIGDVCRIGDQTGTVEDIGLRSTTIRTQDRTLVSIPNGLVATSVLENYRWRDKILSRHVVRLRYDLSLDHLRYILDQIRAVVDSNPKVEPHTWRVRLLRFADYAYEVEIHAYLLEREYANFLATQEGLLLKVIETIEQAGTAIALPSQTSFIEDRWVNPERTKAAEAAVKKVRAPGAPGPEHPQFSPDVTPPKS
jgi:MscS family membrane protein